MKKTVEEIFVCISLFTIMSSTVYKASATTADERTSEITWLLDSLGKELNIKMDTENPSLSKNMLELSSLLSRNEDIPNKSRFGLFRNDDSVHVGHVRSNPLLSALLPNHDSDSSVEIAKRQGNWDYDYGLGGGRFGKRSHSTDAKRGYADYSLGGGRFGRSVDHVTDLQGDEDEVYDDEDSEE